MADDEPAEFVREGKNAMAKTVQKVDAGLRPGDECLLVDSQDRLAGVGRMVLAAPEVVGVARGVAARTRKTAAGSIGNA